VNLVQAIRARLLAMPAVFALVDNDVWPAVLPNSVKELPAIVVRRSAFDTEETIAGEAGLEKRSVEVTAIADTYESAIALADLIRGTWRSPDDGETPDGLNGWTRDADPQIESCVMVDESDGHYFDSVTNMLGFSVTQTYEVEIVDL
jgi:hypothetical protein